MTNKKNQYIEVVERWQSGQRIGIMLGRRAATMVGIERRHGKSIISFKITQAQTASSALEVIIARLIAQAPPTWQRVELRVALSPCFLSCADCFESPYQSERQYRWLWLQI